MTLNKKHSIFCFWISVFIEKKEKKKKKGQLKKFVEKTKSLIIKPWENISLKNMLTAFAMAFSFNREALVCWQCIWIYLHVE